MMDVNPENVIQLMVYDLSRDSLDTNGLKNFYLHECTALQKLSATGLTPRMNNPFPWSDDFLVMAIEPPSGKVLSAYPLPETRSLRNPYLQLDRFQQGLMATVLDHDEQGTLIRNAGIMVIVLANGEVRPGDRITVELPPESHRSLAPV